MSTSRGVPFRAGDRNGTDVRENFSLIVMCVFMVLSLAFLAQQITAYH
jgi:hypothetical protein